ncbi:YetF domain-containing protein [Bacillus sp. LJBV19]|uniref:YetF domain-containing protein n=1 Tax=Bacillus sp. LJBV19 TaxID=2821409 RepID=UPI001FD73C5D|nr:YetF domain-containing protein [Bacillus sp. LJBV19]
MGMMSAVTNMKGALSPFSSFTDLNNCSDIYAILEANGQLGYELKEDCKPLTIKDLKNVIDPKCLNKEPRPQKDDQANIFEEIKKHQTQHKPKNLE